MAAAKAPIYRVLMFPFLAHGHIYPFLELSRKLSSRNFHVYFCSTPVNLDSISESFSNGIVPVELHLPSSPELPPHYHTTKNIPPPLAPLLMAALQKSGPRFSEIIADVKPDLLIYDLLQPWSAKIAASQGIPAVYFYTSGAAACSLIHHWHTHGSFDTYPYQEIGLRDYEKRDLTAVNVKIEGGDEGFAFGTFKLSCEIVLIKSCRGIEGKHMDYLSTLCERKIVPTGPLIAYDESDSQESEILKWLDRKSELMSTLYISFGSENYFSKEQIGEIAKGLEMIDVNFIWVLRSPTGNDISTTEALPKGFVERVKERGMVVHKWAPQAAILAHPNVGGFMSHCGWSSVTESVYFGVPVVALPLKIDQPANARLLTAAGVGVEVLRGESGEIDGEGVAKAINEVFGEEREGLRKRIKEMSEKMKMEEEEDISEVVDELSRICAKGK